MAAEIGEINRFTRPKRLVSYARLAPRVHHSGDGRARSGPLSKSGSRLLGWAALEAAQQAWRESNPWHQLYLDVARRSRHTNAAKATAARKILIAAWHMLSRNQPLKPAPRTTNGHRCRGKLPLGFGRLTAPYRIEQPGQLPPTRCATNGQPSRSNKEELRSTSRELDERPFFRKSLQVADRPPNRFVSSHLEVSSREPLTGRVISGLRRDSDTLASALAWESDATIASRVALLTGASSGIRGALARDFADRVAPETGERPANAGLSVSLTRSASSRRGRTAEPRSG